MAPPNPYTQSGDALYVRVPTPPWPYASSPQQYSVPEVVTAQLFLKPAATAATPPLRPIGEAGVRRPVVVPSPSWPKPLLPQHSVPPDVITAQVWASPPSSEATPPPTAEATTGTVWLVVEPSPSWPLAFAPQHTTMPLVFSAQVWYAPAAMADTPLARPETATGVELSVKEAFPSWPPRLLPQHLTAPPDVSAHAWPWPVAMVATPLARPTTVTGVKRSVVVPSPSCPKSFEPQQ